jgi:hypothetical protein
VINAIPGKSIYYVVFIDDYTGYTWTYFLTTKGTYHDALEEFLIQVQSMTTNKISRIRIGGAWEYKSQAAREQLKGIKLEMSAPYAHE